MCAALWVLGTRARTTGHLSSALALLSQLAHAHGPWVTPYLLPPCSLKQCIRLSSQQVLRVLLRPHPQLCVTWVTELRSLGWL